jgi:hypothetical protein
MPLDPPDYPQFLVELKVAIRQCQFQALRARAASQHPKLQPLVAEISRAKNPVILARCKNPLQREFYLRTTARFGWTKSTASANSNRPWWPPRKLDDQVDELQHSSAAG